MKVLSQNGAHIIQSHEGCKLDAYLCPAKIPTIGYGNTYYENGTKVKLGDKVTLEQAQELFTLVVKKYVDYVNLVVTSNINQNQFDALVCLTYNIGNGALWTSTVLRLVNTNPSDPHISEAFKMWNKADGQISPGLVARRADESKLYFS